MKGEEESGRGREPASEMERALIWRQLCLCIHHVRSTFTRLLLPLSLPQQDCKHSRLPTLPLILSADLRKSSFRAEVAEMHGAERLAHVAGRRRVSLH